MTIFQVGAPLSGTLMEIMQIKGQIFFRIIQCYWTDQLNTIPFSAKVSKSSIEIIPWLSFAISIIFQILDNGSVIPQTFLWFFSRMLSKLILIVWCLSLKMDFKTSSKFSIESILLGAGFLTSIEDFDSFYRI